jgi:hypothetical protein
VIPPVRPFAIRILSGGQTGADRAALDAALALGVPCGGHCPAGRRAEDGSIPARYPLVELPTASYPARTRRNVADADGTAVLAYGPPSGGTKLTVDLCRQAARPCLVIDAGVVTPVEAAVLMGVFLLRHRIATLNVAGPRGSGQPAIYAFVFEAMTALLRPPRRRRRSPARPESSNGAGPTPPVRSAGSRVG